MTVVMGIAESIVALAPSSLAAMLGWQAALCFAIWMAFGLVAARGSAAYRRRLRARAARLRGIVGTLWLLASGGVFFVLFWLVGRYDGLGAEGLAPWAWASVALGGAAFLHGQMRGAMGLLSMALDRVTSEGTGASSSADAEGTGDS